MGMGWEEASLVGIEGCATGMCLKIPTYCSVHDSEETLMAPFHVNGGA